MEVAAPTRPRTPSSPAACPLRTPGHGREEVGGFGAPKLHIGPDRGHPKLHRSTPWVLSTNPLRRLQIGLRRGDQTDVGEHVALRAALWEDRLSAGRWWRARSGWA